MPRAWTVTLAALIAACFPYTSRPSLDPLLGVPSAEVHLAPAAATERLAEALRNDSIPVTRVESRDGYLQTPWFDTATGAPTARSPLGPGVVRVRGWVDPGRYGHSEMRVEVAYRVQRDPSVPGRELERLVPPEHPVRLKVQAALDSLAQRFAD
jgi:hypothetical protein